MNKWALVAGLIAIVHGAGLTSRIDTSSNVSRQPTLLNTLYEMLVGPAYPAPIAPVTLEFKLDVPDVDDESEPRECENESGPCTHEEISQLAIDLDPGAEDRLEELDKTFLANKHQFSPTVKYEFYLSELDTSICENCDMERDHPRIVQRLKRLAWTRPSSFNVVDEFQLVKDKQYLSDLNEKLWIIEFVDARVKHLKSLKKLTDGQKDELSELDAKQLDISKEGLEVEKEHMLNTIENGRSWLEVTHLERSVDSPLFPRTYNRASLNDFNKLINPFCLENMQHFQKIDVSLPFNVTIYAQHKEQEFTLLRKFIRMALQTKGLLKLFEFSEHLREVANEMLDKAAEFSQNAWFWEREEALKRHLSAYTNTFIAVDFRDTAQSFLGPLTVENLKHELQLLNIMYKYYQDYLDYQRMNHEFSGDIGSEEFDMKLDEIYSVEIERAKNLLIYQTTRMDEIFEMKNQIHQNLSKFSQEILKRKQLSPLDSKAVQKLLEMCPSDFECPLGILEMSCDDLRDYIFALETLIENPAILTANTALAARQIANFFNGYVASHEDLFNY